MFIENWPKCLSLFPVSIGSYLNYKLQDLKTKSKWEENLICFLLRKKKQNKVM